MAAYGGRWKGLVGGGDTRLLVEEIGIGEVAVIKAAMKGEKSSNDKKKN